MRALELHHHGEPLRLAQREKPQPGEGCVLLRVAACGVCRTDLHIVDGELPPLDYPVVPGHEIVDIVEALGADVTGFRAAQRIVSCRENLCDTARFTATKSTVAMRTTRWRTRVIVLRFRRNTPMPKQHRCCVRDSSVSLVYAYTERGDTGAQALAATRKGGTVVCAGIHMSDIPSFPYRILWGERRLVSVANLTRHDGIEFFRTATNVKI